MAVGPQQLIIRKRLVTGAATNGRYAAERTAYSTETGESAERLDGPSICTMPTDRSSRTREGAARYHLCQSERKVGSRGTIL
jgi:hypothetical protein